MRKYITALMCILCICLSGCSKVYYYYNDAVSFRLENNKIVFDLEDDPSYEEDRVTIMELIELCGFIIEYENDGDGYILGVNEYGDSE